MQVFIDIHAKLNSLGIEQYTYTGGLLVEAREQDKAFFLVKPYVEYQGSYPQNEGSWRRVSGFSADYTVDIEEKFETSECLAAFFAVLNFRFKAIKPNRKALEQLLKDELPAKTSKAQDLTALYTLFRKPALILDRERIYVEKLPGLINADTHFIYSRSCRLGNKGAKIIAQHLATYQRLSTLNLRNNRMTLKGVAYLADALQTNGSLIELNLYKNKLGTHAVTLLAEALLKSQVLSLDIAKTQMTNTNISAFTKTIALNSYLKILDVSANDEMNSQLAAESFAEMLRTNTGLLKLYLPKTFAPYSELFEQALYANQTLVLLDGINLTDKSLSHLSRNMHMLLSHLHQQLSLQDEDDMKLSCLDYLSALYCYYQGLISQDDYMVKATIFYRRFLKHFVDQQQGDKNKGLSIRALYFTIYDLFHDFRTQYNVSCAKYLYIKSSFLTSPLAELAQSNSEIMQRVVKKVDAANNSKKRIDYQAIPRFVIADKRGDELVATFAAIPSTIKRLDLCFSQLDKLSLSDLDLLKNSLPQLHEIILNYDEIITLAPEKLKALGAIFPNVKNVIFLESRGENASFGCHPVSKENLLKALSMPYKIPSLRSQCAFFVSQHKHHEQLKNYKQTLVPELINLANLTRDMS